jgi:hypothetical protein
VEIEKMSVKPNLEYLKTISDKRGTIIFMKNGINFLNLVEIKQGFSRGGHFHPFISSHNLISGTVEYMEFNTKTLKEKKVVYEAPFVIVVPPFVAHLLTALDDVLFIEMFKNKYNHTIFQKYRKIVDQKILEN